MSNYDIANHSENTEKFVADLEEMSDQFLADINTPFFMEAENDYEMDYDYIEFTHENILKIHEDIQGFEKESFDPDTFKFDTFDAETTVPENIGISVMRRGVIGVTKIGYVD